MKQIIRKRRRDGVVQRYHVGITQSIRKRNQDIIDRTRQEDDNFRGLMQEARKYKTAGDFVKAQGTPVYHGTDRNFKEFSPSKTEGDFGRGIYFTNDFEVAKGYAELSGKGKPRVIEGYVNLKNPYITDNYTWKNHTFPEGFPKDTQLELKKRGYDGVIFEGADGKYQEIVAFDPSQIKTKSQFTYIWNKAHNSIQ